MLVASASFVVLASVAKTSELRVKGSVESNFRNAYDILVRPSGSFTQIERREGLIRDNYLSGIFGGITFAQHEAIRNIRGVEVAAPIANLGYILPLVSVPVRMEHVLAADNVQLYRSHQTWLAHNGRSRYRKDGHTYVYFTRRNRFEPVQEEVVPGNREPLDVCQGLYWGQPLPSGPFSPYSYISCYSERSPEQYRNNAAQANRALPPYAIGFSTSMYFPIFVAAIDPVAEAALLNLDDAITSGRYLRATDRARVDGERSARSVAHRVVPVIASTRTYLDERLDLAIERLAVPDDARLPLILGSRRAHAFVSGLRGQIVDRRSFTFGPLYERLLAKERINSFAHWTVSPVRYRELADGRLAPAVVENPVSIWESPAQSFLGGYWPAPPANEDLQFRRLRGFAGSNLIVGRVLREPAFEVVGRYDPERLPGFSSLSKVPLETYYPPVLEPADEASAEALGGKPLLPTENLGDYIQQPPLLLTTLEGIKTLLNPVFVKGTKERRKAPISSIRVRVAGVSGPDELSMARIRGVALEIRDRTGLDVDITAGSSPRGLTIALPPGKFGRPALNVKEGWVKKGVSVSFLRALDDKRLALFALILVSSGFFLANGAFASVRARRRDIGTLLCLGWSQRSIFRAILTELLVLSLLAGALGAAAAAAVARMFSLDVSLLQTLLVVPVAVALGGGAGLFPAWRAARSVPLDAVLPVLSGETHGTRVRRLTAMAYANLRRLPARALVGSVGLLVGVAALTLLIAVNGAFEGKLVGTLLGEAILFRIEGVDFAAVALIVVLAGLSVADVLFLNLRERAAEIVTLRTVGWSDGHLSRLVALEAAGLGLLGGVSGATLGTTLGLLLGVPALPLLAAALACALGAVLLALLASLLPLTRLRGLTPPTVLAEE